MTNEEDVKQAISTWVESFGCNVLWEKKNKYGHDIFKTTKDGNGTVEKPDILIQRNGKNYFCEVKNSVHKSYVYDSLFQLIKYTSYDFKHYVNGSQVIPDGYMIATENSINGHLFGAEYETVLSDERFSEGRRIDIYKGRLPAKEYNMTEQYIRILWRGSIKIGCGYRIGALLSGMLNGDIPYPMFMWKRDKQWGCERWM